MPSKENATMDARVQLIPDYREGERNAALAEMHGVAGQPVYQGLERYAAAGVAEVANRSRMPKQIPGRVSEEVVACIVAARHRWHWGPRKLRVKLAAAA